MKEGPIMITKTLFAAAAVAATAAISTIPAEAKKKVDVDIFFGVDPGYGYYDPGYGYYDPPVRPRPRYDDDYSYRGISCEQGRQEVRYSGFRKVRALDCDGRRYTYRARRDGEVFIVKVSRRSGDIVSVQPAY
jgi:hypothetical protein